MRDKLKLLTHMKIQSKLGRILLSSFLLTAFLIPINSKAQQNTVKFNVLPLVSKTFTFEYERMVAPKMSVNASLGFRPKSSIPFKNLLTEFIDDEAFLDETKLDHFTFSPEFRFYTSKNGSNGQGFYIGPFFKYAKYNLTTNYPYESDQGNIEHIPLNGGLKTWGFGFAIGSQFKLSDAVFLDFRILGPHIGKATGTISGKMNLSAQEQEELRNELENLQNDIIKIESNVDSEGANVKAKGPWPGIRAGLSIGYRF